jgi:hypothetical protein
LRCDDRGNEFIERLSMKPESVRLGRLNSGAPFLDTHDSTGLSSVIGAVVAGSAKIENGKGVATIKLSSAASDAGASNERLNVKGGMAARAQETYDFWRSLGASREAALGFVGNEQGETALTGGPKLHWDGKHYSGGLVQWDPARRAAIAKALGIDVWHDNNHLHQLQAEAWELRQKYPKLWEALKNAKSVSAAAGALVQRYELPADKYGQSRYRAGLGLAWGKRLQDGRRATGLAVNGNSASGNASAAQGGHIRADVHIHGPAHKTTLKTRGAIEARLHRWPVMSDYA